MQAAVERQAEGLRAEAAGLSPNRREALLVEQIAAPAGASIATVWLIQRIAAGGCAENGAKRGTTESES
jgi:hypothetical protein